MMGHDVLLLCTSVGDTYYCTYKATLYRYFIMPMDLLKAQMKSIGITLVNLDVYIILLFKTWSSTPDSILFQGEDPLGISVVGPVETL